MVIIEEFLLKKAFYVRSILSLFLSRRKLSLLLSRRFCAGKSIDYRWLLCGCFCGAVIVDMTEAFFAFRFPDASCFLVRKSGSVTVLFVSFLLGSFTNFSAGSVTCCVYVLFDLWF